MQKPSIDAEVARIEAAIKEVERVDRELDASMTERLKQPRYYRRFVLAMAAFAATYLLYFVAGHAIFIVGSHLNRLYAFIASNSYASPVAVALIYAGCERMHGWRKTHRHSYGQLEFGLAMATIAGLLQHPRPDAAGQTAALVTSAYFVVRGLDNIDNGRDASLHALSEKLAKTIEAEVAAERERNNARKRQLIEDFDALKKRIADEHTQRQV